MKKILFISDFDPAGSGYMNISTNLAVELVNLGYELKAAGLGYKGQEHNFPFSIIPLNNFQELTAAMHNINFLWQPDLFICALDIPMQEKIMPQWERESRKIPYIGIFPVEGDPLCMDWALTLSKMSAQMCISKFGTEECKKAGIEADYLQIGIDTVSWRVPSKDERDVLRKSFGFNGDELVVLTVADNHERKNLSAAINIVSKLKDKISRPVKHILVTREFIPVGWKLRTYYSEVNFSDYYIFERGLSFKELLTLYMLSDIFLLTSKAEGLNMPTLEAQATGLPVFATDCTALKELLDDGRGVLLPVKFKHRDVFGNSSRYFVDEDAAVSIISDTILDDKMMQSIREKARIETEKRTWNITVTQLDNVIRRLVNEQK